MRPRRGDEQGLTAIQYALMAAILTLLLLLGYYVLQDRVQLAFFNEGSCVAAAPRAGGGCQGGGGAGVSPDGDGAGSGVTTTTRRPPPSTT